MAYSNPRNSVRLIGRLGWEMRLDKVGEYDRTVLMIAVDRGTKNKQTGEYETDWVLVSSIGEQAKKAVEILKKGDMVAVEAAVRSRMTEEGGKKRTTYNFDLVSFQKLFGTKKDEAPKKAEAAADEAPAEEVQDVPF